MNWKTFAEETPKHEDLIIIKCKNASFPEVGVYLTHSNFVSDVYLPANDDAEKVENIEKWLLIPKE